MMHSLAIEILAVTTMITSPPEVAPVASPATTQLTRITVAASVTVAMPVRPATIPWAEFHRREAACSRPGAARAFAARLGAGLAWSLADLPRHQLGATRPWFRSSDPFGATVVPSAGDHGAISACIAHWNTVYPPYALTTDPSEEPSCPGN